MNITTTNKGIFRVEFDKNKRVKSKKAYDEVRRISDVIRLGTYGGVNTDVLYREINEKNPGIDREEICADDDEDIGLRMPSFWPINFGSHSLSTAMYYVKEQMRYTSGFPTFPSWNREVRENLGWLSLIEVYDIDEVKRGIDGAEIEHFSTPRTLMECVRNLEDWGIDRLEEYKEFSDEIEDWSKEQDFYDESEWRLGREESKQLMKNLGRKTNVRLCVEEYWKQVLLNRGFSNEDRELDILSPDYEAQRSPKIILVGENFLPIDGRFTKNQSDQELIFRYNFRDIQHTIPINTSDTRDTPLINAQLLRARYPRAKIGLMTYGEGSGKLFKLIKDDGVKEGISEEVVFSLMAILGLDKKQNFLGGLETCLH